MTKQEFKQEVMALAQRAKLTIPDEWAALHELAREAEERLEIPYDVN